ncbi:MAG TPA: DUF6600 domain-containing protein [Chthoniobacterales bacterium]|nr:DUF6600 domain-containing protein [Chthoniobacterales bacterium]
MKKLSVFPLLAALAVFVSCQKQQTEEERKAEVERQVQDRLAAEKAAADKEQIAKQQAELDAREKALADREAAATATPPTEEPVPAQTEQVVTETSDGDSRAETRSTAAYGMFYEKLDPYGEWRETSDYGYVWQPREAESSRDWRPYTEGRWVYSDAGWTWVSDEKFGWATYHYGRWVRLRRVGWVWVPGEEWAPAWVSWRTNKDYVGWAPLPPEARFDRRSGIHNWADSYYDIGPDQYSFVPANDFGDEHVRRAVVPADRNASIVVETTNVTRITYSNTTIVNEGPSYDELRSRGQRPIERYRLRRDRNTEVQARISGAELEVSVPVLSEVRNVFRPRRVKERVTEVNVDNGWTSVSDRSAAERARTKIRAEATPPPNAPPKKFVPPTEAAASSTPAVAATTTPGAVSPSAPPVSSATPTPAATVATSATTSPVASASPRTRPSPSMRPRLSPSPTPAPAIAPAASSTPPPTVSSTPRTRPSPSIPARISPTASPTASAAMTAPTVIPRRTLPPVSTKPAPTPTAMTEPSIKPVPSIPPVKRPPVAPTTTPPAATESSVKPVPPMKRPSIPPRTTFPTPTVAPEANEPVRPPPPRDIPKRTIPPRMTPPPATSPATTMPAATPTIAPSSPGVTDERAKTRRPPRSAPPTTESGTPTPTPSTPER